MREQIVQGLLKRLKADAESISRDFHKQTEIRTKFATLDVSSGPPEEARGATLLSAPRDVGPRGGRFRAFESLRVCKAETKRCDKDIDDDSSHRANLLILLALTLVILLNRLHSGLGHESN